jgi:TM2 domain-containing membrane protein YozV
METMNSVHFGILLRRCCSMDQFRNINNQYRRYKAHISVFGTSQLHLRNPYIVAWWSAAFPGFGHLLLGKYMRGFVLFIWEVIVNLQSDINAAMVDSFRGHIELAKQDLHPRWMLMYIPVYLFAIWDSYRTTIDMNNVYLLAERENAPFNSFSMGAVEINYLDKRKPAISAMWSLFMPGLGQLYVHRVISAFFALVWTIIFLYFSHALEAIHFLFLGEIHEGTEILNKQWFLYMPSMWGFSLFDSYMNTVENNKLFDIEQKNFLKKNYQNPQFVIKKGKVIGQ